MHNRDIAYYMLLPYKASVFNDTVNGDPCVIARHEELPGCIGQGKTAIEAIKDLRDARFDYISSLLDDGLEVPLPKALSMDFTVEEAYSPSLPPTPRDPVSVRSGDLAAVFG